MASSGKPVLVDIDAWLDGLGLSIYREAFAANHIDGATLPLLTAADLQEIGVTSVGHRRRLIEAIAALGRHTPLPQDEDRPQAGLESPAPSLAVERAPTVERRQVTVMFCDLVGSTALSARLDPEDLNDLLAAYRCCVGEVIERNRGFIAHYVGDGVLAYFGYPYAQEQDAERTLRTGLAIIRSLGQLAPIAGVVPEVRIGVATGLVVVGNLIGTGPSQEVGIAGETPNLAARLQALAGTNELVISQSTRELVGNLFECVEIGRFELKGLPAPVPAWRVLGERVVESRFDALRSGRGTAPLIGRESELARISDRLTTARGGSGQVVVVVSQAGFGKSRLVEEVHRLAGAEARGRLVLQCSPDQGQTPFYPVIHHLEFAAGIATEDSPAARRTKLEALLTRTGGASPERLAVVFDLLRIDAGDGPALSPLRPAEARARTLKTLLDLTEAATTRTSVIVAEDIHWADPSTIELLGLVVRMVRNLPALFIATARPGFANPWEDEPHVTVLRLDRLPPPELRRLVYNLAGADRLSPSIVEQIVSRSDGVPLFAQELARGILAKDRGQDGGLTIPSTLTESLVARLDGLDHGRETAQLAAVIGREFPIDLLVAISPGDPNAVRNAIRGLIEAGIFVKRHSTFGDAAGFYHALLRDAAYELLLRRDRTRLHEKVATALEQRFPDIAGAMPHLVAQHLTAGGNPAKAIDYWERAGIDAAQQSSPVEAVSHFQKAIGLLVALAPGSGRDECELRLRLDLIGPLIAARGHASPEVAEAVEHALDLHHRSDSGHSIVPALTLKWLAQLGGGDIEALYRTALQITEEARDAGPVDRLLAHRTLGSTLLFRGEIAAAVNQFTAFMEIYDRDLHDPLLANAGATNHASAGVMLGLAECYALMNQFKESEEWRRAMFAHAEERHHVPSLCPILAFGGCWLAVLAGNADELTFYASELRKLTTRHDLDLWRPHADLMSGLADIFRGEVVPGHILARRGVDALIAGNAYLLTTWLMPYAEACERNGWVDEALEILAVVEVRIRSGERWLAAEFHRLRARLNWARDGQSDAIKADFDQALAIARRQEAGLFERRARTDLERWLQTSSFAS
ncbi:MAG TPA: adenylate/guanylate cyclase domain-containing protein [Stellaceae bacterium]|nr:adenylate/guanylate cyclase domain-containing protein [Stellaceae bacterium]